MSETAQPNGKGHFHSVIYFDHSDNKGALPIYIEALHMERLLKPMPGKNWFISLKIAIMDSQILAQPRAFMHNSQV